MVVWATGLAALISHAEPIQFLEQVSRGVQPTADVSSVYSAITEFGDNSNGGVGAESHRDQPAGGDGQKWFFFQTGNGGKEAGIRINLGQGFEISDGDSIQVSMLLGEKRGQAYTDPVSVMLTDGLAGRPLALATYAPAYTDGKDQVTFLFKEGLRGHTKNRCT